MFNALLLGHDKKVCTAIENLGVESKQVFFQRTFNQFPQLFELARILNIQTPDLVFIDLSDWASALAAAGVIRELSPRTPIVGFGAGWEHGKEEQFASAGITELLISPVTLKKFQDGVDHAIHKMKDAFQKSLFAFLPAKAGSGSTTIALNTAGYLANNHAKDSLENKVLLIEADLRSGVLSVLLDIDHPYSLRDALDNSEQLDYSLWTRYVWKARGVDVLPAHLRQQDPLPLWTNYHHLLSFAAPRYETILVDLPEVVNDATVEIVRRAERVFVVCTPEPASLSLAPQRCAELSGRGIHREKIGLIVNRWHRGEMTAAEVEKLVGYPVSVVFGNDYATISKAARAHEFVDPGTKIGRSYAAFARQLAGIPDAPSLFGLGFLKGLGARGALHPNS